MADMVLQGERRETRRIVHEGRAQWVRPEGDELVLGDGRRIAEADATYLAPCEPTKIIAIHINFPSRRDEFRRAAEQAGVQPTGRRAPSGLRTPTYFQKPTTSLTGHRGTIPRPADCKYLNYEGELAVVIGRPMKNVAPADTWDYIAGVTCGNDVALHDYRDTDNGGMTRVKGMDGFCPLGPGLVSGVDLRESSVRTYINGEVVQEAALSEMEFGVDYMLADLCRHITLLPGDVLLTGTPQNSRPMMVGDVVEVEVTGVGKLTNEVIETPSPAEALGHQPTASDDVLRVALGDSFRKEP